MEDTTGKGARGPLPVEAAEVEYIVGSLDSERASRAIWSADDFNQQAAIHAASSGMPAPLQLSETKSWRT